MRLIDADKLHYKKVLIEAVTDFDGISEKEAVVVFAKEIDHAEIVDLCKNCGEKAYCERVSKLHDCNDCGKQKICGYLPRLGEDTRINCPLWADAQINEAIYAVEKAIHEAEEIYGSPVNIEMNHHTIDWFEAHARDTAAVHILEDSQEFIIRNLCGLKIVRNDALKDGWGCVVTACGKHIYKELW